MAANNIGGLVTVGAGVSSQHETVLHFVNGTVTSAYYFNHINPVIVLLHEQDMPYIVVHDDNTPAH